MKLTIIAMIFGIELPSTVTELPLTNGRIFKNPIILAENLSLSRGDNLILYKEQDGKRQIDRDAVKYLADVEVDTPTGTLSTGTWRVSLSGSGGVSASGATGLYLLSGQVREEIKRVLLPLRLGTKARVIAIPAKVQGGSKDKVSEEGLDQPMPEPFGESTLVELTKADYDFIAELSEKISHVDLAPYQVPIEIFQDSFYNTNAIERGLNIITALESLFSQGSDSVSFKLAYRTSCILDFNNKNLYQTYRRQTLSKEEKYQCQKQWVTGGTERIPIMIDEGVRFQKIYRIGRIDIGILAELMQISFRRWYGIPVNDAYRYGKNENQHCPDRIPFHRWCSRCQSSRDCFSSSR